ncbi:MAG: hypothetical protein AAF555_09375 [Verrucomicrobiota bacterium]
MSYQTSIRRSILLFLLGLCGCVAEPETEGTAVAPVAKAPVEVPPEILAKVGQKIWTNECGGTVAGLTSWNAGEDFASLGIGHFIWYPGPEGPFKESFPAMMASLRAQGVAVPGWALGTDCPWPDKPAFEADREGPRQRELRALLSRTVMEQTRFIVGRLEASLPQMLRAASPGEGRAVLEGFRKLQQTPHGLYALIDYVNFKGEGTHPSERYQGVGWGLLQVLEGMEAVVGVEQAPRAFSQSAARVLARRVELAPPSRQEGKWLAGWRNRVTTYASPF